MRPSTTEVKKLLHRPTVAWLLVALWMVAIFAVSAQPQLPHLPDSLLDLLFKKTAHATAYAILCALWLNAFRTAALPQKVAVPLALFLTFGYAISDEWHQTFVPGRHGQPSDVLIDTTGALIFLAGHRAKMLIQEGNR